MSWKTPLAAGLALALAIVVLLGFLFPYIHDSREAAREQPRGESPELGDETEYVEVVDFAGRKVVVPRNVTRVVAIGPGALRLIAYLQALDLVVGVEEMEKRWTPGTPTGMDYLLAHYSRLKDLPTIGPGGPGRPPNPELIAAVRPQLIVMSRLYMQFIDPDRLEAETGAKVVVVDYGEPGYLRLEDFKRALMMLGKVLGREERALELVRYVEQLVLDLRARTGAIEKRPVVYVGAVSYRGPQPFTSTQGDFVPFKLINTPSIVDELGRGGFVSLDFEYIIKRQPEVVFIDENNLGVVLGDFRKNPQPYCSLVAFREGRVYGILPYNHYHTNVATALANAYWVGYILYPSAFSDIDPVAKANEIYRVFLGRELYEEFVKNGFPGFASLSDLFRCP
ncbi:MAG: ABC transporter substrate-binding protein [Acidilobaceae archaeon]